MQCTSERNQIVLQQIGFVNCWLIIQLISYFFDDVILACCIFSIVIQDASYNIKQGSPAPSFSLNLQFVNNTVSYADEYASSVEYSLVSCRCMEGTVFIV